MKTSGRTFQSQHTLIEGHGVDPAIWHQSLQLRTNLPRQARCRVLNHEVLAFCQLRSCHLHREPYQPPLGCSPFPQAIHLSLLVPTNPLQRAPHSAWKSHHQTVWLLLLDLSVTPLLIFILVEVIVRQGHGGHCLMSSSFRCPLYWFNIREDLTNHSELRLLEWWSTCNVTSCQLMVHNHHHWCCFLT